MKFYAVRLTNYRWRGMTLYFKKKKEVVAYVASLIEAHPLKSAHMVFDGGKCVISAKGIMRIGKQCLFSEDGVVALKTEGVKDNCFEDVYIGDVDGFFCAIRVCRFEQTEIGGSE